MQSKFKIGEFEICQGGAPVVVAEISGNHNGSLEKALDLIDAAAESGAHAVKFQTYTADTMTIDCDKADFQITDGLWAGRKLYDLYEWAHTPWEWHEALFDRARKRGLVAMSTPFDESSVDFLEKFDPPAYKIASFEANDHHLIRKAASTGKPLIISTGLTSLDEIREAVDIVKQAGGDRLALLHCVSSYPTPADQVHVRTVADMAARFGVPVGLSDHTLTNTSAIASVAIGACIVEKHFTFRRDEGGPDAAFSLEPDELKELCAVVQEAWAAAGEVFYECKDAEKPNLVFRRSLYVTAPVGRGEEFSKENVRIIRPGYGMAPKYYDDVIGKRAKKDIERGTPLSWDVIA